MISIRVAIVVFMVILIAAATLWMAWLMHGMGMPLWGVALGPILLILALVAHFKTRR